MAHAPIGMILTAGFGTRLYPLNLFRPKPMMEVISKPIIYFIIKTLERAGIKDIILNLHYYPEEIRKIIQDQDIKCRIHFVYEKQILGTAGGIVNALETLNISKRNLVVFHGDIFCDIDIKPFLKEWDFCSLICDQDREIKGYEGNVAIDGHGSIVTLGKFYQSSSPIYGRGFFTGIHFLSSSALELIKKYNYQGLVSEIYPQWLRQGIKIKGIIKPLLYDDLGSLERIFRVNMLLLKKPSILCFAEDFLNRKFFYYGDNVFINKNVKIAKTAKLYGPLIIAEGARIEEYSSIGPNVVVGKDSLIKQHAKISNSIIMSRSIIEKDERIDCKIALNSVRVSVKGETL